MDQWERSGQSPTPTYPVAAARAGLPALVDSAQSSVIHPGGSSV